ncbi:hypothetical protein [Peribacillus kribbensis]|uniref:hypothetical protein n=1 Tax=Peribacillus kribbensis TaxID=356658 RepID=UPI0003FB76CF|nr:hypothetical protein [Peribacillus kribbensis]
MSLYFQTVPACAEDWVIHILIVPSPEENILDCFLNTADPIAGLAVTGVEADLTEKILKIYSAKHSDSVKIRNDSKRILASINKKDLKIKVFPGGEVHIRKVTNEEIVNERILNALNSGLTQKKEWKVEKAEYVQNAQTIIIKTSLTAGRKQTKMAANNIDRDVHEFISSEQFADRKLSYRSKRKNIKKAFCR